MNNFNFVFSIFRLVLIRERHISVCRYDCRNAHSLGTLLRLALPADSSQIPAQWQIYMSLNGAKYTPPCAGTITKTRIQRTVPSWLSEGNQYVPVVGMSVLLYCISY